MTQPAIAGAPETSRVHLAREISLLGLVATAFGAMIGVGVNILPFMVQRSQPGIGDYVPLAYLIAAVPPSLAAVCYALLASAMPRAGGSYVNATRALDPFAGFLASFAQWFGLSIGMGVVAYLAVPMLRDVLATAGLTDLAPSLDRGIVRVPLALAATWFAWWINVIGVRSYQRTLVVMATITIVGPIIMTFAGALFTHADFDAALRAHGLSAASSGVLIPPFSPAVFGGTCVILFSSFIGGGVYDNTPDRRPLLGPVNGVDGLFLATGFSGHGFMIAPAVGEVIAASITGRNTDLPLKEFSLDRFSRAPSREALQI